MKARLSTLSLVLGLVLALPALAEDVSKLPGYVDLDWIRIPDGAAEIQDIVLDPVLAGLAASGGGGADAAALNQALAMVKSVRVKSFSLGKGLDETTVTADVKRLQDRLAKDSWQRLIYMKDGDETVTVSTLHRGEKMVGLMLLTYEPGDSATFVNVVGDLDLSTLLRLATQMHGDEMGEILKGMEDVHGHAGHTATDGGE